MCLNCIPMVPMPLPTEVVNCLSVRVFRKSTNRPRWNWKVSNFLAMSFCTSQKAQALFISFIYETLAEIQRAPDEVAVLCHGLSGLAYIF